jgi:hypothetical protein
MELKRLEPNTDHFECCGKKYYLTDKLSFIKFEKLSEWSIEFGFSATFQDMYKNLLKIWEAVETNKFGTISVTVHNMMTGIVTLEQKYNVAFRICSLFIIEEGEDEVNFNEAKMNEKIENWGKEYDATFFFNFAANIVPNWIAAFKLVSRSTTDVEMEKINQWRNISNK